MDNQISPEVKEERSKRVIELSLNKEDEFKKKFITTETHIIPEVITKEGFYMGHTANYLPVYLKSDEDIRDILVKVKITDYKNNKLIGEII